MPAIQASLAILCGITLSMIGDIFLKQSGFHDTGLLIWGILFYALGAIPVAFAFGKIQFGVVFLIWQALSIIVALILASLLFKEPFTPYKLIALLLVVGALCFSYL